MSSRTWTLTNSTIFTLILIAASAVLIRPATAQQTEEVMSNQTIIDMVAAKLPEDVVIAKIQASKTNFDLSTAALVLLNKASVPASVVKAMMAPKPANLVAGSASGNPNDPSAPHDAGIYLYTEKGQKKMVLLEPTVYTQGKTGGVFASAMTYGIAKIKWKAVVRNAKANVRFSDQTQRSISILRNKAPG